MRSELRVLLGLILGGNCGAMTVAVFGAVIGRILWETGLGVAWFSDSWVDWPIGGALFGAVVGGFGGILGGIAASERGHWGPATGALPGAGLGVFAFFLMGGGAGAVFGAFGPIGGAVGAFAGGRVVRAALNGKVP